MGTTGKCVTKILLGSNNLAQLSVRRDCK